MQDDRYRLRCTRCEGCGRIASTEEGEPWKYWDDLPVKSAAAVLMGVVYPLTCPVCDGKGYTVPTGEIEAALDDIVAAALRRMDRLEREKAARANEND